MKGKILITGSTGFVGRNLVPKLINEGFDILEITRDISKSISLFKNNTSKLLADDLDFKIKIIDFKPEIVIHLASYLSSSDSWTDIETLINTNILFLSKVLDAVSNVDLKLFVNTGTFAEYYDGNDELRPAYFYAATKTASRSIVDYYSRAYNFKQSTIIPFTIYGGKDSKKKILDLLIESTKSETPVNLTPGNQVLDFIHINDVVEFYTLLVMNKELVKNASVFKLGTGVGHTLKEVARIIENIGQQKTKINWGAIKYRNSDVMYAVADLASINASIKWKPKFSLEKGIIDVFKS